MEAYDEADAFRAGGRIKAWWWTECWCANPASASLLLSLLIVVLLHIGILHSGGSPRILLWR